MFADFLLGGIFTMKDKTEITDRTDHYLVKLCETIKNAQEKIKLEKDNEQLESVSAIIAQVEQTQDTAIQKRLISTAHIQAKNFQLVLIDLMIASFSKLSKSEEFENHPVQELKDNQQDVTPLLNKLWGNIQDSINTFSKTMDYFSTQFNEDVIFIKRLEEAKNWLENSDPDQEIELADFNDLINTYAIILEKKNGSFSAAKATDFSSGDNINQSNERKKNLTELTSELAEYSKQYVFQVNEIRALYQGFEEKIALVKSELDKQVLLSPYNSLLQQQAEEVIGEREKEFMDEAPHSIEQVNIQIAITQNAQATLKQIHQKLNEFLESTLNPAIVSAERKRVEYSSSALQSTQNALMNFKKLLELCERDNQLKKSLKNYENDIETALKNTHSAIDELSTKKLTTEQIEAKCWETITSLNRTKQLLEEQISRINRFRETKASLEEQLNALEEELQTSPLVEMCRDNINALYQIKKRLQEEKDIYSGIPADIPNGIVGIKTKYNNLKNEYNLRSSSNEVIQLNQLLSAIDILQRSNNTPDWVKTLKSELEEIKLKYLASKINREQFKFHSAQAIATNVTDTEVRQLTNKHESATHFGNFFRALAEFIVAIGYSIKGQEKPLYRPQFFASHQEKEIAGKLNETYKLLNIIEDPENQLSKSMLNN